MNFIVDLIKFRNETFSMDDYQSLIKDVFKRVAERTQQAEMTQPLPRL